MIFGCNDHGWIDNIVVTWSVMVLSLSDSKYCLLYLFYFIDVNIIVIILF